MLYFKKNKELKEDTIFIQIASYRDKQLLPTLRDCISKAKNPENLRFSITWQHSLEDEWDTLDEFKNDDRFRIIDVDYRESKGVCWARNLLQQQYNGEKYTLQLDSHHRFIENWDIELISMLKYMQSKGYAKPLITGYIPSFDPIDEENSKINIPWKMVFDRFSPDGNVHFFPEYMDEYLSLTKPVKARFYSAHFAFTLGEFAVEVQHDPEYYFHGEEISIAVRAFTHGYDLFHPHKVIAWHEYTRKNSKKQWDDDSEWVQKEKFSHKKNRELFYIDERTRDFGKYDFGTVRSLEDYEKYSGLNFKKRAVQQYTLDKKYPPNPIFSSEEYENSFVDYFKHCIDISYSQVPHNDYNVWAVAFEDINGNELIRLDAYDEEITRMKNDPDGYCKLWREFITGVRPYKWIVWPHSIEHGWGERIEGILY
jgi:hypothetical protein